MSACVCHTLSNYLLISFLFVPFSLAVKYVAKLIKECHYSLVGKYNCCGIKSIMTAETE